MKTLLRIDASAQRAESHSRRLADHYEANWRQAYPGGRVVVRDLVAEPIPHLDEATVAVLYAGGDPGHGPVPPGIAISDTLIAELIAANDVVVSSAVYNFNVTSSLKAWVDHIVRFGQTIAYGEKGVTGLLAGRSVCLITARGGNAETSPVFQTPSLQATFGYLGFSRIDTVPLEGTKIPDGRLESRIAAARARIDALFLPALVA